jgi:hypothetical protein
MRWALVLRPGFEPADRALFAAVSRTLLRSGWSCFLVKPDPLLRWHRRLVAGAWTYPRGAGRPPLDQQVQQLIVRLARENPRRGYQRIQGGAPPAWCAGLGYHDPYDAAPSWPGSDAAAGGHHLAGVPAPTGCRDRGM